VTSSLKFEKFILSNKALHSLHEIKERVHFISILQFSSSFLGQIREGSDYQIIEFWCVKTEVMTQNLAAGAKRLDLIAA